jgi:hypothetical protein
MNYHLPEYKTSRKERRRLRYRNFKPRQKEFKYGCEVVPDGHLRQHFTDDVVRDLHTIGIHEVIKLNRRKKGLTSSGRNNQCHMNVLSLVSTLGGRHKHGFLLEGSGQDDWNKFQLTYHSAWLTPEKKLVCVTPRFNSLEKTDNVYFVLFDDEHEIEKSYNSLLYCPDGLFRQTNTQNEIISPQFVIDYKQSKFDLPRCKQFHKTWVKNNLWLQDCFKKKSILTKKRFCEIENTESALKIRRNFETTASSKKQEKKIKTKSDALSFKLGKVA